MNIRKVLFAAFAALFLTVGLYAEESLVKVEPAGGSLVRVSTQYSAPIVDRARILRVVHWGGDDTQFNTVTHEVWSSPTGLPSGIGWVKVDGITAIVMRGGGDHKDVEEVVFIPAPEAKVSQAFVDAPRAQ